MSQSHRCPYYDSHLLVKINGEFMIAWKPCADVFVMDNALSDIDRALAQYPNDKVLTDKRAFYEQRRDQLMRLCRV
ncbi:MAG: hypothetical protein ABSH25_17610 [Syntrophorhabdales bacterium]